MRALLQRVLEAKVVVDGETTGEIQHGILVFLGLGKEDTLDKGKKMIDKILKYRFFDDEQGKMGWNVSQAGGGILLPVGNRLDIARRNGEAAVFEAQQVFEQHFHREGQARNVADRVRRLGERIIGVFLAAHIHRAAGA